LVVSRDQKGTRVANLRDDEGKRVEKSPDEMESTVGTP
jgi:hypothetical protein